MAKKPSVTTISSGFASNTQLNTNFTALRDAFDNTLSLDGSTPNAMQADLDLNGNSLLNVADLEADNLILDGQAVVGLASVPAWRGSWTTGVSYAKNDLIKEAGSSYICLVAHTAGTFSTDLAALKWELFAEKGAAGAGTGDMLAANNLSDVANVSTARANLGLGTMATQNASSVSISGGSFAGSATITAGTITGITDLAIADGGTGASTAAGARTNLGLAFGATADLASQAEAEAGTNNTKVVSPLRVAQAIAALSTAGSQTLLGTTNTPSGSSATLSGLTLTGYKGLLFIYNGVNMQGSGTLTLNIASADVGTTAVSAVMEGTGYVDLATGIGSSFLGNAAGTPDGATATSYIMRTGLSTASTSITFSITGSVASFGGGSILTYGVK